MLKIFFLTYISDATAIQFFANSGKLSEAVETPPFEFMPTASCGGYTGDHYIYESRTDAETACVTRGCQRLCDKDELDGHSYCASGWTSDWKGLWLDADIHSCGVHGYNDGDGYGVKAGAYCCDCDPCPTPSPTPSPTSSPTPCDNTVGTCTVSEDPHVQSFDGAQASLLAIRAFRGSVRGDSEAGDKWLVKSKRVFIQARYMENGRLSERALKVRAVAVGGEFLEGKTLVIGSLEDNITFNGKPVLESKDSNFEINEDNFFVKARRGQHSALVQNLTQENNGVNIELPSGVSLVVNRLHYYLNVAINMPAQEGGQDGLCGNNNGLAADDSLEFEIKRVGPNVPPEESLFSESTFVGAPFD